jgi:FkbM family methyltransferase
MTVDAIRMNIESIKLKLDNFGMIYYRYLKFREVFFPTQFQKDEKKRESERISFYSQFFNQNDLVFDIGANYGNRTSVFLSLGAKVVALEPQEHCLKYLKKKFGNKVDIVAKVVSDSVGELNLFFPQSKVSSGTASLSVDWIESVTSTNRFPKSDWNHSKKVISTTMDDLIKEYGLPKFCKIDVEGHETSVIQGLSQPIESLSFEFTTPERRNQIFKVLNLLSKVNSNYEFNFCVGENLTFLNEEWLNSQEMINEVETNSIFNSDGLYGDIYCRNASSRVGKGESHP